MSGGADDRRRDIRESRYHSQRNKRRTSDHLALYDELASWLRTYSDGAKDIDYMPSGRTFAEAAMKALHEPKSYPWRDRDGRSLGEQMGW
jgi:TorA maturation chaperone TorD